MKLPTHLQETIDKDGKHKSPRIKPGLKNYVIDIDGVVCEDIPNEEPERMVTAAEIPGSREQINKWFDEGNIITFFTSRSENEKEITLNWLKEHGFKFHNALFGKPRGGSYHYIDDRDIESTKFTGSFNDK
ncbi:phosphoheptose isomerase [candidate division KSB1 bacterium]